MPGFPAGSPTLSFALSGHRGHLLNRQQNQQKPVKANPKIIVVDDDSFFLTLMEDVLARQGYDVVLVEDSSEALGKILDNRPDLIITDLCMDCYSGLALISELRTHWPVDCPPILVVTGMDLQSFLTSDEYSTLGEFEVLAKPFRTASLLDSVERQLAAENHPYAVLA